MRFFQLIFGSLLALGTVVVQANSEIELQAGYRACAEMQFQAMEQRVLNQLEVTISKIAAENISNESCHQIMDQVDRSYSRLYERYIDSYRQYLNDFYTQASAGKHDVGRQVEGMKRLAGYMRKGEVADSIAQYRQTHNNNERKGEIVEKLHTELRARYKTLRKSLQKYIGGPTQTMLPVTEISCGRDARRQGSEIDEQLQWLISDTPVLDLNNNCSFFNFDGYDHPSLQKILGIEINDDRIRISFCHQRFESHVAPNGRRGNYGNFVVTSHGNCLVYDLENQRFDLGDQWEMHDDDPTSKWYHIEDTRAAMARAQGLTPMTLEQFGARYPELKVNDELFQKIPQSCQRWRFVREGKELIMDQIRYRYRRYM